LNAGGPAAGEVHVWCADLDTAGDPALLDDGERDRVERVMREPARRRTAARRAVLRELIALSTGLDPAALPIVADAHGRPSCPAAADLDFSCTSSGRRALYALARGARVGIDVELVADRPLPVRRYMTERELGAGIDPLRAWVVKEAVAKGVGTGLRLPPAGIEIERLDPEPAVRLRGEWAPLEGGGWHVRLLAGDGWVGAVASDRAFESVVCREWSGYALGVTR
jgi:4'-phosphopantetheinyl transferase